MMRRFLPLALLTLLPVALWAQQPKHISDQPAAKPKLVKLPSGPPDAYLFPLDIKAQLRDLQYKGDQLEIQNRQLEVEIKQIEQENPEIAKRLAQIAQNKTQQAELLNQMKLVAFDFASKKKIDLQQYELDPAEMKMAKKKKSSAAK